MLILWAKAPIPWKTAMKAKKYRKKKSVLYTEAPWKVGLSDCIAKHNHLGIISVIERFDRKNRRAVRENGTTRIQTQTGSVHAGRELRIKCKFFAPHLP